MNIANEIVAALRRRGMKVTTTDGFVTVEPDKLTKADEAAILANKAAIVESLESEAAGAANPEVAAPAARAASAAPPDPAPPRQTDSAPAPEVPAQGHTAEADWKALSIDDLLAQARAYCDARLRNCGNARRPQIRKLIYDLAPLINQLKDQGDLDPLRLHLGSLRDQIETCISSQPGQRERTENRESSSVAQQPLGSPDVQPLPTADALPRTEAPPEGHTAQINPIPQDVRTLLERTRTRTGFAIDNADPPLRLNILVLMGDFEPLIDRLLAQGDYPARRVCLVELQRQLDWIRVHRGRKGD